MASPAPPVHPARTVPPVVTVSQAGTEMMERQGPQDQLVSGVDVCETYVGMRRRCQLGDQVWKASKLIH